VRSTQVDEAEELRKAEQEGPGTRKSPDGHHREVPFDSIRTTERARAPIGPGLREIEFGTPRIAARLGSGRRHRDAAMSNTLLPDRRRTKWPRARARIVLLNLSGASAVAPLDRLRGTWRITLTCPRRPLDVAHEQRATSRVGEDRCPERVIPCRGLIVLGPARHELP